jgi:hypothetical protein
MNTRPHDIRPGGPAAGLAAGLAAAAVAVTLAAGLSAAAAADTWTTPHPGVKHLARTTGRPWRINALVVDLCAAGVSLRATAEADRWRTVGSFADRVNAEAAVNGDFFSYETHLPTGLAISGGDVWHADMAGSGEILFGDDRAFLNAPGAVADPPVWAREAVSGRPLLVDGGAPLEAFNRGDCVDRHPRTAIGLSEDRRTLFLAVVDGRSNASIGMNCAELADLMDGLGAHRAMNLDGGGSSTMYVAGRGVVNDPSDGNQRTVANHLGIQAQGTGPAGSCAFDFAEVWQQAYQLDTGGHTDVNGDGRADLCARASNGIHCRPALADPPGFGDAWRIADLSDDAGFDTAPLYATIRMGDVTGDGRADVCARRSAGFDCWPALAAGGFGPPVAGPRWADDNGWRASKYYSTIRLADLDDDGRLDVCARAAAGVRCHLVVPDAAAPAGIAFGPAIEGPPLTDDDGWGNPDNFGTIRMGDVDGDGRADLCARANGGYRCWRFLGDGFAGAAIDGPPFSDAEGFADVSRWSTIRLEDLDGDGRADACGRMTDGYRCFLARADGTGFGDALVGPAFRDDNGWGDHDNYGSLQIADVDGDGHKDVCARAGARFHCWLWDGAGWGNRIDGPTLSDDSGWGHHVYNTAIRVADVTGDGRADVCARAAAGIDCWVSDGATILEHFDGPAWSNDSGWSAIKFFSTLRLRSRPIPAERCNGRDDDFDGETDEGCLAPDAGLPPPGPETDTGLPPPGPEPPSPGDGGTVGPSPGAEAGAPPPPTADARPPVPGPDAIAGADADAAAPWMRPDALRPTVGGDTGPVVFGEPPSERAAYAGDCTVGAPARAPGFAAAWAGLVALGMSGRCRRRRRPSGSGSPRC